MCFPLKQREKGIKLRMKETIIYLLRHSEQYRDCYNFGENEKIILSIDGEKKAEELSNNPELLDIKELWSSSYSRAIGTAKYIAKKNNLLILLKIFLISLCWRSDMFLLAANEQKTLCIYAFS